MRESKLIIQDTAGDHNNDLSKTRARLMRGASWKRQNVVVVIPAAETIASRVALSHWNLAFPPNNGVARILALGQEVGEAYSNAIESILSDPNLNKYEYLLTLEHDNMPPSDGVLKLIECLENNKELACISGLYFTMGPGGVAQIWGDPTDPVLNFRPQIPRLDGSIQECNGLGMGFTLFRLDMFKDLKLRRPWFKTQTKDGMMTQDLYFFSDAKKNGYRCAVDTSCRVGHYDLTGARGGVPDKVW